MNTATRSLYKIWRCQKGRSLKRWLSDEQVAKYKAKYPNWRWQKVQVENRSYQASLQSSYRRGTYYSSTWGYNPIELRESARNTGNPVISWDDILDVQLALKGARI